MNICPQCQEINRQRIDTLAEIIRRERADELVKLKKCNEALRLKISNLAERVATRALKTRGYGRRLAVAALLWLLAVPTFGQLPPQLRTVVRTNRPPVTNYASVTLGWSNSTSAEVISNVLCIGTNVGRYFYSCLVSAKTNQFTVKISYVGGATKTGWCFAMKAIDGNGNASGFSNEIWWHVPWLDYSELIVSGTPPFHWSGDLANWMPLATIQNSFVIVNNGGARFFKSGGKTTIQPTIK